MGLDFVSESRDGVSGRGEASTEGGEVSMTAGDVRDFVIMDDL